MSSKAPKRPPQPGQPARLALLLCLLTLAAGPGACGFARKDVPPVDTSVQSEDLEAQTQRLEAIAQVMTRDLRALERLGDAFFALPPPPTGLPLDLFRLCAIQCLNTPPLSATETPGSLRCQPAAYPLLLRTSGPVQTPWITTQMQRVDAFRALSLRIRARAAKLSTLLEQFGKDLTQHRIDLERMALDLESTASQYSSQTMAVAKGRLQDYRAKIDALDRQVSSLTTTAPTWGPEASRLTGDFLNRLVWFGLSP